MSLIKFVFLPVDVVQGRYPGNRPLGSVACELPVAGAAPLLGVPGHRGGLSAVLVAEDKLCSPCVQRVIAAKFRYRRGIIANTATAIYREHLARRK